MPEVLHSLLRDSYHKINDPPPAYLRNVSKAIAAAGHDSIGPMVLDKVFRLGPFSQSTFNLKELKARCTRLSKSKTIDFTTTGLGGKKLLILIKLVCFDGPERAPPYFDCCDIAPNRVLARRSQPKGRTSQPRLAQHQTTAALSELQGFQQSSSQPLEAQPLGAQPPGAQPPGAQLPGAQPLGAQPLEAQPLGAQPLGAQPLGAQPPGAQPLGAQPPGAQPLGAQLPGAQPLGAQLPGAQPPGAQPLGAQLPGAQPLGAQPPEAQPVQHSTTQHPAQPSTLDVEEGSGLNADDHDQAEGDDQTAQTEAQKLVHRRLNTKAKEYMCVPHAC